MYIMKCAHCSESFTSERRLRQHERAKTCHTQCPSCGKKLATRQTLQYHLKSKRCRPMATKERASEEYDFGDLDCYDCGDLMARCDCPHTERLNNEKKQLDARFRRGAYFDDIEGVPWENRPHWNSVHHGGCGGVRDSEDHIFGCLYPLKDRTPRKEAADEELMYLDNVCWACRKAFSSKQRLRYHMSHNVCGGVGEYDAETDRYYDALAQKCEDDFAAEHAKRIKELGNWIKGRY